jgi:hypothetical protein
MRVPLPAAMITTWSAMRLTMLKSAWLLAMLVGLLTGCSTLRLAYDTGPHAGLVVARRLWRLQPASRPRASRTASDRWFDWHRTTQLPDYAALLAGCTRGKIAGFDHGGPGVPAGDEASRLLDPAIDQAVLIAADLGARPDRGAVQARGASATPRQSTRCAATSCSPTRPNGRGGGQAHVERADMLYGRWTNAAQADRRGVAGLALRPRGLAGRAPAPPARHLADPAPAGGRKADRDRVVAALRALAERVPSAHPTRNTAPTRSG